MSNTGHGSFEEETAVLGAKQNAIKIRLTPLKGKYNELMTFVNLQSFIEIGTSYLHGRLRLFIRLRGVREDNAA